ncbi:MAG: tetratricopeptide repeat protein, partial [Deltaproteobacteria bacterium]|nr:tetratricopeptide repeat protein [Deltaproteobacteria bacterium]
GGAVYMVFFTDQGLLGFSLKKSEAKSRLEQAAEEASNLTPELLQELDQKYTQANKLLAMDSYDFYEKAKTIYKEILDAFSNHPKASSGLAEATMMAGRGYLDTEDFNQVQQWVRQADTVSPNTPETLRAQIRFLQFQGRSDEAKARLTQLLKIEENNIDNLMVAAELSLIIEDFEATQTYLTKLMELDPNRIRAHYIQASLTQAQGKVVEAVKMYQALMESNQHIPSTVAYYQYLHAKNDQTILEPLNKIVAEQKSKMGPKMYAACYKMISEIFAAQGNEEKSIITLELAVEKMSRNDVYAYELGLKHEHLKAYEKSVKYFEQAYTIKPDHHEYTVAYGRNLRFVGKSKEAEALLKKVVTAAPEMESAIVQYAESRADQGFYAEVTTYLQEVLTKTPGFVDVQNLLAMLYLEQNEFKEAAKILNDAIKNAKTDIQKATVHRSLGILALKQEKYDLALKHLTTSNKLQPNNASTLGALGKTYYYKQEYQESEKYIIDSLNIDQLNYEARGILAQIYFDKGKPGEAKKVINEILEDDPKNVSLRVTLGKMLIEEGQYIEAIDHLDEAYLYDSENYETYYYLGIAERESGKVDISLNSFTKAIEIWSESHNAYYQRGLTFIRKNDIKNASLDMEKANQLKPDWTLPNKAIAKYYYEINNFDKAGEQFKAIVDVNAKDEEALYYLGKSYFYQEKTSEALKQFNALLKLSPNDGRAHYEIGVIYEDAGDFQQALTFLSNAKAKNPKNPSVYYHLGFVLKNLDQPKQAVVAFQTYLQLDPKTIERAEIEDEIYRLTYHH